VCAKVHLHISESRCYSVERCTCYSRKTWIGINCEKGRSLAILPGEIVGDRARRLNKPIVYNPSRVKIESANPSKCIVVHCHAPWKKSVISVMVQSKSVYRLGVNRIDRVRTFCIARNLRHLYSSFWLRNTSARSEGTG